MTTAPIRPLHGIRVLDLSSYIAGPFCTTQLAEFGAEVIKLELPGSGDALRRFGTRSKGEETLLFLSEQRNKKSVTLDLRTDEGAGILKRLVREADILVENFQGGTLERWGAGWAALRPCNPRLIMVRTSGYRHTGPYRAPPTFRRISDAFTELP